MYTHDLSLGQFKFLSKSSTGTFFLNLYVDSDYKWDSFSVAPREMKVSCGFQKACNHFSLGKCTGLSHSSPLSQVFADLSVVVHEGLNIKSQIFGHFGGRGSCLI